MSGDQSTEAHIARAGQPLRIAGLFIALGFSVILWLLFDGVFYAILDASAEYGTTQTSQTGHQYLTSAVEGILPVFIGISIFGLIVFAVYRSQL